MRNAAYSDKLNAAIKREQVTAWEMGTPTDSANESHQIAVEVAYKDVPADGPPPKLDQKYVDAAKPVVEQQLQRGGVRLGIILNDIFSQSGNPTSQKSN